MAVLPPDPVFNLRCLEMGAVHSLCFHNNERLLAGTVKGNIHLWDLQTNRSLLHFAAGKEPILTISHTEDALLTQEKCSKFKLWKLTNSGYILDNELNTENIGYCRMQCIPEQNFVILPNKDNTIGIYDLHNFSLTHTLLPQNDTPLGSIMSTKYINIADQNYILGAFESGDFLTWDLRCNKVINQAKFEECPIALDYDPITNRGLYGGTTDKIGVFSYSRNSMEIVKKTEIAIKNPGINCIKIRDDQKVFTTGGSDNRVRIFSWKSLRPLAVLTEHKKKILDISYSSGKVLLWKAPIMATAGEDAQISLWDLYN